MDPKNQTLALAVVATVAGLAVMGGLVLYRHYEDSVARLEQRLAAYEAASTPTRADRAGPRIKNPTQLPGSGEQRQRIHSLQALLEQKDRLISEQRTALEQLVRDQDMLKEDVHAGLALIERLARQDAPAPSSLQEAERLRLELLAAEAAEPNLQAELQTVRQELMDTEDALTEYREEAEQQFNQVRANQQASDKTAKDALSRVGESAVAVLIKAPNDDDPAARRWAAEALGHVGLRASDAIDPLTAALRDEDESVRVAARMALQNILP